MVVASIFAEAFVSVILEETWDKAKNKIAEKPATKVFEYSVHRLKNRQVFEGMDMEDFLKLCHRARFPESRRAIESAYQNLGITEQERGLLFRDFKEIFPGNDKDLKILFEEFLDIFLREIIENCKDTDWKYWVWTQLKVKGEREILLESFEEALNFDVKEAEWFRGSPFWIDFEENRIYRREEIDFIKEKLEKENIQIVCGNAASGKSVIVNYIGYEYCKEPKSVYVINLRTDSLEEYKKDIIDLLHRNGLLIIEDAHLAFHDVDWVVRKARNRKLKILISMRPIEEKTIPREPTKLEDLMKKKENFTEIKASNSAKGIIKFYFSQKYGENRVKEYEEVIWYLIRVYSEDLWFLSFALEAFLPETGLDITKVYDSIYERYLKRILAEKNKFVLDTYKYLYPICIFYQFEIPVCKDFLLKNLDLNEIYLNQLINTGEIQQKGRMLLLHHSSRAKYFLEAIRYHKLFAEKEETEVIRRYIKSYYEFACDLIIKISRHPYMRLDLIEDITSDKEVLRWILKRIDEIHDLKIVRLCLSEIAKANENAAKKFVPLVAEKINGICDLGGIGSLLSGIAKANENVARELAEKIDVEKLAGKLEEAGYFDEAAYCFLSVAEANENVAKKLIEKIDAENIAKRIDDVNIELEEIEYYFSEITKVSENFVERLIVNASEISGAPEVGACFSGIAKANENIARELAEKIDVEKLAGKLEESRNLPDTIYCLSGIAKANENVARELVPLVAEKIDECDYGWDVEMCLSEITKANENVARELVVYVVETSNLEKIEACLSGMAKANENVARELVAYVVEICDLEQIGACLSGMARYNENVAREFAEKIDVEKLANRLEESQDLWNVIYFLSEITKANENVARELAEKIDVRKSVRKIEETNYLDEAVYFLSEIARANENVARELVPCVAEKIDDISNLDEAVYWISEIADTNKDIAEIVLNLLCSEKRDKIQEFLAHKES